jgi:sugar (pentulose or hexulose) kinase
MKVVLDIGKTNVKLQLLNNHSQLVETYSMENTPVNTPPYPHANVQGIWRWLLTHLAEAAKSHEITDLIVTTHGATAALVNEAFRETSLGLVMPVLDYEYADIESCNNAYQTLRPHFTETLSPALPAGLNLGRQLFWQQTQYPDTFAQATYILMYPQYWAWLLTGKSVSEVTSLGCHTDLWAPAKRGYSSLVSNCGWNDLLPPMAYAGAPLGTIRPELVAQGLPANCQIYAGLHDSNASYLRYLKKGQSDKAKFTVISSGTWTILMQAGGDFESLATHVDTLANCDVFGNPTACARFMGGREYDEICRLLGGSILTPITLNNIQDAITHHWMVTPDFSDGNGPFGHHRAIIQCPTPAPSAGAIATLYCALMIDQRLTDLNASGDVYIEGAFLKNPLLCQLVARLRANQSIYLSTDATGTVQGALQLINSAKDAAIPETHLALQPCPPLSVSGLDEYRLAWQQLIAQAERRPTSGE